MSCNICVEKYNKSSRAIVTCIYCDFTACTSCCKRYILNSFEMAHCMSCKKEWNRRILIQNFSKSFVDNVYKKHYENILFKNEILLLPATQNYIEIEKKRDCLRKQIHDISVEIFNIENKLNLLHNKNLLIENQNVAIQNSKKISKEEKKKLLSKNHEQYKKNVKTLKVFQMKYEEDFSKRNILKIEYDALILKNTFVKKCTYPSCRGFLSSEWKCSICDNYTCENCHEIKDNNKNHICNNDTIETVKLITKDTKNCPNCGVGIFKIEGCDQMYCVDCHTPFSWTTGKIENGTIHNPHYYEWMRNNGHDRNLTDIQCGREINHEFIYELMRIAFSKVTILTDCIEHRNIFLQNMYFFENACQYIINIRNIELPKYNVEMINNNLDLRVLLITNNMSEENFKKQIYIRRKDMLKKREIANVISTYINCSTDIMYRFLNDLNDNNIKLNRYIMEMDELKKYIEECLIDISNIYKSTCVKLFNWWSVEDLI